MAKRVTAMILAVTIAACGSAHGQSGQSGGRLSDADYRAAMERAAAFVEPGGEMPGGSIEQMKEGPPTGSELGFTAKEAAQFLGK
ncbi:MAG TPA: hypothetical protein VEP48_02865 [Methylomirabilota bacterium]|nr:hypothetical protein [Methylomirabilota bacterium]